MKHRRGIELVRGDGADGSEIRLEHIYSVEVWSDAPEAGGELLETIAKATDFQVSAAAYQAALRQRPGKTLIHLNGRYRMTCEVAKEPSIPLVSGRPSGGSGREILG